MKKYMILFVVLLSTITYADISFSGLKDNYHIGESISLNVSVDYKKEVYGFFKLSLVCTKKRSDYFLIPLLIKDGKTAQISPEPLKLSKKKSDSDDECFVRAYFLNEDNYELLSAKSDVFEINTEFDVSIDVIKTRLRPGDDLIANIIIDMPDDAFTEITLDLTVDKKLSRWTFEEKEFTISYKLPADIKSGKQEVIFQIEDLYGNYHDKEITLSILTIPSSLKNLYLEESYNADETLTFKPVLYDQSSSIIDDKQVNVVILNPSGKEVDNRQVTSTLRFSLNFDKDMRPGQYTVISQFEGIEKRSYFNLVNSDFKEEVVQEVVSEETQKLSEEESSSLQGITGYVGKVESSSEGSFNFWKYLAILSIIVIVVYGAYSYGKISSSFAGKKEIFKKDEFNKKSEFSKKKNKK